MSSNSSSFGPLSPTTSFEPTATDYAATLDAQDASTSAPEAARDEPILTEIESGADQLLSTAAPNGLSDPFSTTEGGWIVGPQEVNPYTNLATGDDILASYVGQNVNYYTGVTPEDQNANAFTGGQNVDLFTGLQNAGTFSDGLDTTTPSLILAYDAAINENAAPSTGTSPGTDVQASTDVVQEASPYVWFPSGWYYMTEDADGNVTYRLVAPPDASKPGPGTYRQSLAGAAPPAPSDPQPVQSATVPAAPSLAPNPAPAASAPPGPSTPQPWGIGDLLATIAGLFGPTSVGPSLGPQTPANLPAGLQQMGQLNASMAHQSMQATGVTVRRTLVAVGAPYAAALGALAAPAISPLGFEAGIAAASRFPTATSVATGIGNALTWTTVPRVAIGVGAAALAGRAGAGGLCPELNEIEELNDLFGQKVQENASRALSALSKGDYSVLKGWLTPPEYNATMRALAGDIPRGTQIAVRSEERGV